MPLDTYRKRTPAVKRKKAAPTGYDWSALLRGYPGYSQSLADLKALGVNQGLNYDEARQRAVVGFGGVTDPALAAKLGQLPVGTQELAAQNPYSSTALSQRGYDKAQSALVGNLAGRGALRSGAYLQHTRDNLFDLGQQRFTATQGLLDTLGKLQSGYTSDQQGLARDAATATAQATAGVVKGIGAGLYPAALPAAAPSVPSVPRTPAPPKPKALPAAPMRVSPQCVRYGAI